MRRMKAVSRVAAVLVLLCGILLVQAAGAEEFDRTVPVRPGTRLDVRLYGGTVVVRGWGRDEVRVRATHFRTDQIDIRPAGQAIALRARARIGQPHAIDFTIDVPAWMAVSLAGTYIDVTVQGTRSDISARTVRGDIRVQGGAGSIVLKSIQGEVVLEGGEGRADLTAVSDGVRVTGLAGELVAQTVNGAVKLQDVRATSVAVSTVGGDISWQGAVAPRGRYEFATHDGDIDVWLPPGDSAAVSVRLFGGRFSTTLPVSLPDARDRRKAFTFVLGSGAARVGLETFRGTISVRQAGAEQARPLQ